MQSWFWPFNLDLYSAVSGLSRGFDRQNKFIKFTYFSRQKQIMFLSFEEAV